MDVSPMLRYWADHGWEVVHKAERPGRPEQLFPISALQLSTPAQRYLNNCYPGGLYRHQIEAIRLHLKGDNVALTTSTASGKSVPFYASAIEEIACEPGAKVAAVEEVEAVVEECGKEATEAVQKRNFQAAKEMMDRAEQVTTFLGKVKSLQREWAELPQTRASGHRRNRRSRRGQLTKRLRRGLRTPEEAFRMPILEVLVEIGGSGPPQEVLARVYHRVETLLTDYDRQPLASDPDEPRWRKTVHWCRKALVEEGLLSSDSPRGIWEIAEAGRAELTRNRS